MAPLIDLRFVPFLGSLKDVVAASRTSRSRKKASAFTNLRYALVDHLGRQSDDVWGLILFLAGLLSGLSIYADAMGVAGHALHDATGLALGWGEYFLPAVLCGTGAALMRDRLDNEPGRIGFGLVVMLFALTGFGHLFSGTPEVGDAAADIRTAGGYVGIATAGSLHRFLGPYGAAIVFVTLFLMSVLVLARLSVRSAIALTKAYTSDSAHAIADRVNQRQSREVAALVKAKTKAKAAAKPKNAPKRERVVDVDTGEVYDEEDEYYDEEYEDEEILDLDEEEEYYEDGEYEDEEYEEPVVKGKKGKAAKGEPASVPEIRVPVDDAVPAEQLAIGLGPAAEPTNWKRPPLTSLKRSQAQSVDRRAIEAGGRTLEDALASHGVETKLVGMTVGPSITRYELELGPGVKVARVTNLNKDIAYAMASPDVRILAPIPGRSAIGIEVPNTSRALVTLGDILSSEEAHRATHPLEVALGRDIAGRAVMVNLATMPHVLIAGATGAGKSSCINSLISSILIRNTPDQVRMILVDPKRVELGQYNGLPHLLTQVVTNPKKAANALQWAVTEMERRYDLLAEVGVRDITGYNAAYDRGDLQAEPGSDKQFPRLPFILLVVDELNDLMMVAARDVEASITRIAQMARAVGIHLVIATQRPSVDVITGVIKANIPSRMAFAVSSLADSRVILDQPGAERLIGQGDMLLLSASSSVARRIQGAWVTEEEVKKVVAHWTKQGGSEAVSETAIEGIEDAITAGSGTGNGSMFGGGGDDDDDLLEQAMELVVRSKLGSTSMLQRKLRVGFARAGRLMDLLEQRGVVGPSEGSKARTVMMTIEEFEAAQGSTAN